MKVAEVTDEDEYIFTRIDNTVPAVNIVNIYGSQESRSTNDEIEKSWYRLMKDVKDIEARNESVIIIGDMNRHIGNGEYGIKGNKNLISHGGQLIRDLIQDKRYILINNLDLVEGGPWTWQDRKDKRRQSCLDLGIMSISLLPYLKKVVIDKYLKFTPRRVIKTKKTTKSIFSDHYAIKIELNDMPKKQEHAKQETFWNLNNPGGWDKYETLTAKAADEVEEAIDNETDIDKVVKKINVIETKIKFKAFGKTRSGANKVKKLYQCSSSCTNYKCNTCKSQKQKDEELIQKRTNQIEQAVLKIKESRQGRAGNIFKMRKEIAGSKKNKQEASAIRHPETGEIVVNKNKIKKVTLAYCVNNLKKNHPDEEVKESVNDTRKIQLQLMKDTTGEGFKVTWDDFNEVIDMFKKKDTNTYDFLIKASNSYKNAIFRLCQRIIDKEEIPDSFRKTVLIMIWKRKGSMDILKNNRFLHMKEVLARSVDALIVNKMKGPLTQNLSMYQVGGLPGHSILEHLFTLKTVLTRLQKIGKGFVFLVVDIISFFDKENIYDCLETLETLNVNKKAVRMWYLMNMNTKIAVKTAFGMTEEAEVGDCLGQGTAGAGLVSAANLDLGLQRYFNNSPDVMHYGDVKIQPLSYQDDVGTPCTDIEMARCQAQKMSKMLKYKSLEAHQDKSGILILGSNKYRDQMKCEAKYSPIYFNNFTLETKTQERYLGQIFQSDLGTSALATVKDRQGKIKGAAIEVKAIIEDFHMQAMGGLVAAWELWEKALIPSLLSGAGTWLGNIEDAISLCNKTQNFYWRTVLKVPESCPKLALLCEPNMTDAKWRIWETKCLLLLQIQGLEDGSLAKAVYQEAELRKWPGLGNEVRQICQAIGIPDINIHFMRKKDIQIAIKKSHYEHMMALFEGSRKLEDIKNDSFHNIQPYFDDKNLESARIKFKIRTKMLQKQV